MHWQIHKGGGFHYHVAEQQGSALPVAVVLGADPALMLAGIFPLPEALEEIAFAGLLSARRTRLRRAHDSTRGAAEPSSCWKAWCPV
jgi:UbiD family decarboxylase